MLADESTTLLAEDGIADKPILLDHSVVIDEKDPGAENGSREESGGVKSERHDGP